jgi:hypothetical protein
MRYEDLLHQSILGSYPENLREEMLRAIIRDGVAVMVRAGA